MPDPGTTPATRETTRHPLRVTLTIWMVVISFVIQLTLGLVVLLYQRSSITRFMNDRMEGHAGAVASGIVATGFQITDDDLVALVAEGVRYAPVDMIGATLYREDGTVVASSLKPAADAGVLGISRVKSQSPVRFSREVLPGNGSMNEARLLFRHMTDGSGKGYVLVMAESDAPFEAMMQVALRVLLLSMTIGTIASAVAGWYIAGLAVSPLTQFRQAAKLLTPESIDREVKIPGTSQEAADLERELEDTRAKLRQAFQTQDRFISNVSHELKTPIAVLLTEAQTLSLHDLPEHAKKFVQSVTEEIRRLGRTVESFLTLAKVRAGKTLVNVRPIDMNDIVVETVANCAAAAKQYGVQISPQLLETETATVVGDQELLRAMLDNLVRNAIRFSPRGAPVMIRVQHDGTACTIHVRDAGPGICDDLLPKIFDRFVQAEEEATRGRGQGLGLSIAQGIAELHGGKIKAQNVQDPSGCEFEVWLPLGRPPASENRSSQRAGNTSV